MPILNEQTRNQLKGILDKQLTEPLTVHLFTQRQSPLLVPTYQCQTCRETGELMDEVKGLTDKLTLQVHDLVAEAEEARRMGVDKIPALVFQGKNKGTVRYFGIPAGYEFSVLVEGLIDCARGTTRLSANTKRQLQTLAAPVNIKVLVTPTCPYCPMGARLAHQMAIESSMVTADVIEVSEFPQVAQRYHVFGVPKTIINERVTFEGALPEARFLEKVLDAVAPGTGT